MSVHSWAKRVALLLKDRNLKVVFAESCTGGGVSAALTKFAGISDYHCGGVVVYRNATKTAYLEIDPRVLKKPGAVSRQVAELLAERVLEMTPEADVAASVTGHLGPGAPPRQDGVVFIAVALLDRGKLNTPGVSVRCFRCTATARGTRQAEVIEAVLQNLAGSLEKLPVQAHGGS